MRSTILRDALDVPVGLSVEQTAETLGVSQPTVRRWIKEQFLMPVEGRKPLEIEQESVRRVADELLPSCRNGVSS